MQVMGEQPRTDQDAELKKAQERPDQRRRAALDWRPPWPLHGAGCSSVPGNSRGCSGLSSAGMGAFSHKVRTEGIAMTAYRHFQPTGSSKPISAYPAASSR